MSQHRPLIPSPLPTLVRVATWNIHDARGTDGQHGNALLTTLPVDDVRSHDLSVAGREPRSALEVIVRCAEHRVRVVVTHLGLRAGERRRQVERLLRIVADDAIAPTTVLLGDINEWWLWGRPLRWLHRRFGASPAPLTFPARLPIFALDRIWAHPRPALTSVTRVANAPARRASDHLPVIGMLRLPAPD